MKKKTDTHQNQPLPLARDLLQIDDNDHKQSDHFHHLKYAPLQQRIHPNERRRTRQIVTLQFDS